MAKVKHIQVNELPAQLEANAIYFVRNTGEIWQTDSGGEPVSYNNSVIFHYGAGDLYISDRYYISNQNTGVVHPSFTGRIFNSDILAINSLYTRGFLIPRDMMKLDKMSGYLGVGNIGKTDFIIGYRRYDNLGNVITSGIIEKFNIDLNSTKKWNKKFSSSFELMRGDELLFLFRRTNYNGNVKIFRFYNQITLR